MSGQKRVLIPPWNAQVCPRRKSRLSTDEWGAMFLLAGLLLVLGLVAFGATLFMTSNIGEHTARSQRDGLTTPVNNILMDLNETTRAATSLGDTNITGFLERLRPVEDQMRTQAAREGIYMEIETVSGPDPSLFVRPSRCIAYDPARSFGGVILGYESSGGLETIAGVVYHVKASSGKETLDIQHYVRIATCLPDRLTLRFDGFDVDLGRATNETDAKQGDDGNAAATLTEDPQGSQVLHVLGAGDPSTLEYYGWSDPHGVWDDGHLSAQHPATPHTDYLRFDFDTTGLPDDLMLHNATMRVDAYQTNVDDDYFEITALHNDVVVFTFRPDLTETEQTYRKPLGPSPGGNASWTMHEAAGIIIQLKVIEVDKFDPPAFFDVDHATIEFDLHVPERHVLEVGVDYPRVPAIYDTHSVELRYGSGADTTPEEIHLQLYDTATDTWNTRIVLDDTNGTWVTETYDLTPDEIEDGHIEMRLVDTDRDDWHPKLEDGIQIDHILLHSEF